jgi:putative transposase
MDFVHDQLFDGTKIRALTIVDVLSRVSPAIGVRKSYRGAHVVETLERGAAEFGYPKTIRVDNGPEFVAKELDLWAYMKGVTLDFSRPGKPTDNAFIESFNGKFRTECLNANWFLSLDEARVKCEAWRRDYNEVRPHSAIGNRTPMELHRIAASPASRTSEDALLPENWTV